MSAPHLTAMLIFWDESADQLEAWARSIGQLADRIVAADGPFADYEHTAERSSRKTLNALKRGAESAGVELEIIPGRTWRGQVEKRDCLLKRSLELGTDWLFWSDADERLLTCDRDAVRSELSRSRAEVFWVDRYTPPNPDARWRPDATQDEQEGERLAHLRIFRALDDMEVLWVHWLYTGRRRRSKKRVAFAIGEIPGSFQGHYDVPAREGRLKAPLLFEHLQTWRSDEYRRRMVGYRDVVLQAQIDVSEP